MTTSKTNQQTIANAFDSTFAAIQIICKDFKDKQAFRTKEQFISEQEAQAEEAYNYYQRYYGI